MNRLIWLRPVLSCCFVWNAGMGMVRGSTTEGGQDKRPDAPGRYGVVVVGVFACCALGRSAALTATPLIIRAFHRTMPDFREART